MKKQNASVIPKFLRNKYLLVVVGLVIWLAFFDRNDLESQYDRKKEVEKLENDVKYYHEEIARNRKEMTELQSNPKLLEKFAREHYLMKKDNEDIFVLVPDTIVKPQFEESK